VLALWLGTSHRESAFMVRETDSTTSRFFQRTNQVENCLPFPANRLIYRIRRVPLSKAAKENPSKKELDYRESCPRGVQRRLVLSNNFHYLQNKSNLLSNCK
jgi:hypothetical protein